MANIGLRMLFVGIKNEDGTVVVDAEQGVSEKGVYAIDTNKSHMKWWTLLTHHLHHQWLLRPT